MMYNPFVSEQRSNLMEHIGEVTIQWASFGTKNDSNKDKRAEANGTAFRVRIRIGSSWKNLYFHKKNLPYNIANIHTMDSRIVLEFHGKGFPLKGKMYKSVGFSCIDETMFFLKLCPKHGNKKKKAKDYKRCCRFIKKKHRLGQASLVKTFLIWGEWREVV